MCRTKSLPPDATHVTNSLNILRASLKSWEEPGYEANYSLRHCFIQWVACPGISYPIPSYM